MIIWTKWGILVLVITAGLSFLAEKILNLITSDPQYWHTNQWPISVVLVLSGVICWFVGKYINKTSGKTFIDKENGTEVFVAEAKSTLFFIPMEYWGPILGVLGVIFLVFPK